MTAHVGEQVLRHGLPAGPERARILAHLEACPRCRERFLAGAPERAFALLALARPPELVLEQVSRGVRQVLERERRRRVRPWAGWAAAAAGVVLALALFVWHGRPAPSSPVPRGGAVPVAGAQAARAGEEVRLLESPGEGRVVDFEVGDVKLVMIFDEKLEL